MAALWALMSASADRGFTISLRALPDM